MEKKKYGILDYQNPEQRERRFRRRINLLSTPMQETKTKGEKKKLESQHCNHRIYHINKILKTHRKKSRRRMRKK